MGFAPVTNPAFIIVVTINGTSGSAGYGAGAAAPIFKAVATEALRVLDVPRDLPDASPEPDEAPPADIDDLAIADLGASGPNVMEEGAGQSTPGSAGAGQEAGPKVPNFRGKTMRVVVEEASAMGLPVLLDGSGIARAQMPPAGSVLHDGERIRVQFAR
jgi:cell division protein FtsI (penicillin-binding protein 3)